MDDVVFPTLGARYVRPASGDILELAFENV